MELGNFSVSLAVKDIEAEPSSPLPLGEVGEGAKLSCGVSSRSLLPLPLGEGLG